MTQLKADVEHLQEWARSTTEYLKIQQEIVESQERRLQAMLQIINTLVGRVNELEDWVDEVSKQGGQA